MEKTVAFVVRNPFERRNARLANPAALSHDIALLFNVSIDETLSSKEPIGIAEKAADFRFTVIMHAFVK